jgi:hypothetical protein
MTSAKSWLIASTDTRALYRAAVFTVALTYVALSTGSAMTRLPVCDEAWYANPAFNLTAGRSMGTTVLESAGTTLQGLERHTYWIMPLYIVGQALVYEVFGPGLMQTRLLSAFWGLVILASWFVILRALYPERLVALLAIFLMAVDSFFIGFSSTGRSDAMCAGLGSAALAAYLGLRARHLTLALFVGNALIAGSGLTHPNGILYLALFVLLFWRFDRENVRWFDLCAAASPYVVGAMLWGAYVLQSPADFLAQFGGSARTRLSGAAAPLAMIKGEALRYANAYGLTSGASALGRVKAVILLAYLVGIAGTIVTPALRRQRPVRILLSMTALIVALMVVVEGAKQEWYLVHIIPLFCAVSSVWIAYVWRQASKLAYFVGLGLAILVVVNVGAVGWLFHRADYQNIYLPVVQFLNSPTHVRENVIGSAELGFQIGFERLTDDFRLGYYSGKRAGVIVVEENYEGMFRRYQTQEPDVYRHVTKTLSGARKVFDNGRYRVYELSAG